MALSVVLTWDLTVSEMALAADLRFGADLPAYFGAWGPPVPPSARLIANYPEAAALQDDPVALARFINERLHRSDKRRLEKWFENVSNELSRFEYVHLASHDFTGRAPLPEPQK